MGPKGVPQELELCCRLYNDDEEQGVCEGHVPGDDDARQNVVSVAQLVERALRRVERDPHFNGHLTHTVVCCPH